jgi:hypothetical protein
LTWREEEDKGGTGEAEAGMAGIARVELGEGRMTYRSSSRRAG